MRRRIALTLGAVVVLPAAFTIAWIAWPLPESIVHAQPVASVTLLDRNGLPLRTTRSEQGLRGGWLSIDEIDADVIRAFVAAEDQRFYQHHGVDVRALLRAVRGNVAGGRIESGASTITMQTARLMRGTKRTWLGKLEQTLWALRIDAHLSKTEILERYLNRVPLGQGTVGVPAAAALYFEASAGNLSIGQAALLAGFARSPARDNALASHERAQRRRRVVLARMQRLGYVSSADVQRAAAEPIAIPNAPARFLAPHFTTRVLQRSAAQSGVVHTTLDLDLQNALEAEVRHTITTLRDRAAAQAAAVVLDNRNGDVLAWVGSPDFFAESAGQVDMVVSPRQPGSALKPFLYGAAFDRGFTAATVLPDVPRTYATAAGPYKPQNYDRRFHGPVRARVALASSFNVPAVELADRIGTSTLLGTLHDAGFASLDRSAEHYGLGLALGNGDVTLLELANAYRGIANGGTWQPVRMVADENVGTLAGRHEGTARRFMTTSSAALILDILSDPVARTGGFGTETPLEFAFRAAAKTGTSRHYTDNWALATTARFTVAVWVGNFSGRPMQKVSGITGAGPLLHRAVLEVARRYPPGSLMDPERAGLVAEPVCILSGMHATPSCPSMMEWFAPGTEPQVADTWQNDGRVRLPTEYAEWSAENERGITIAEKSSTSGNAGTKILSPLDGDHYQQPPGVDLQYITIPLVAEGENSRAHWSVDNRPLSRPRLQAVKGTHVIRARWPDGSSDSVRIVVE